MLLRLAGTSRFLYNKTIQMIRDRVAPFASVGEYRLAMGNLRADHDAKESKRRGEHKTKEATRRKRWEQAMEDYRKETRQAESSKCAERKRKIREPKPFETKEFEAKEFEPPRAPWLNKYWMRNYLASGTGAFHAEHPWLNDVPKHTKEAAVYEAIEATKAALSNLRGGNIKTFDMSFRSKKRKSWSVSLAPNAASGGRLFARKFKDFGVLDLCEERGIRDRYKHEITIKRDDHGRYFMVTLDKASPIEGDNQAPEEARPRVVMSIDPGQRTRHCVYSTGGHCYKIGDGDSKVLMSLCKTADRLVSLISRKHFLLNSANHRRFLRSICSRKGLFKMDSLRNAARVNPGSHRVPMTHREIQATKRRLMKTRARISDLKDEIDNQTINFLCKQADVVLIPKFDGHQVSRRLVSKTARALMDWRHGTFRSKLVERAASRGTDVLVVSEHYTTKTCGRCGFLKENVGAAKVYRCDSCDLVIDRDFNGARNIFLRAIRRLGEAPEGVEVAGEIAPQG